LCNDCHDKVHVYRTKTEYHPIYGKTTKRVLVAKQIKKRGGKKKIIRRKKSTSKGDYWINPITGKKVKMRPLFQL